MVLKCKMCGGDLDITTAENVCECEYCGTKQTVPAADSEKKLNLFNRAHRLRFKNEFDKAEAIYESIISEFPEEAEAYWGICLCRYGIEYVDDPKTGTKIPTCHRTSFKSIFEDDNFKQALENADVVAQKVYRDEARAIDALQKDILSVVSTAEPYDVFICYKETGEDGQRTPDSVLAQDIYDGLTAKGLRVFFARITLEDKLGTQYEPYIFAALNSAKVMLVVGTKYEYLNAVWVKNEWSRYLDFIKTDRSRVLIPCYKGMDPYDLPDEFGGIQAQDMSKIGAMQDLVRGVMKLVQPAAPTAAPAAVKTGSNIDNLLKRGFMSLEEGSWEDANRFFERVLDEDVECGEAYWGKFLTENHIFSEAEFDKNVVYDFDASVNFKRAMKYSSAETLEKLKAIYENNAKRIAIVRLIDVMSRGIKHLEAKETTYQKALQAMNSAITDRDYLKAARLFETLAGYSDSAALAAKCAQAAQQAAERHRQEVERQRQEAEREREEAEEIIRVQDERAYSSAMEIMEGISYSQDTDDRIDEDIANIKKALHIFVGRKDYKNCREMIAVCNDALDKKALQKEAKELRRKSIKGIRRVFFCLLIVFFSVLLMLSELYLFELLGGMCILLGSIFTVINIVSAISTGKKYSKAKKQLNR